MTADAALTCDYCRKAPATHLIVTDWHLHGGTERRLSVICGPCADYGITAVRHHAAGVWLYALAQVKEVTSG